MIRNIKATSSASFLNREEKREIPEKRGYKQVHDSFQSIFREELGKVRLTMEDVRRLQGK